MANLFALPWRPIVQNNLVVPGAKIYFTLAGTNTASAPFLNSTLATPRTNPVVADGTGKVPTTYLDPAKSYRVRVYSKNATIGVDTPLEEYDPYVPGIFADAGALQPVADAAAQSATAAANSAAAAGAWGAIAEDSAATASSAEAGVIEALGGASISPVNLTAATRVALAALDYTLGIPAMLSENGREGFFVWNGSDLSYQVAMDTRQAVYVPPASDTDGSSGAWVRRYNGPLKIEWFGGIADSDGTTGTDNLAALNAAIAFEPLPSLNFSPKVEFGLGKYYLSSTLEIETVCHLIGQGSGSDSASVTGTFATMLVWPVDTLCIRIHNSDTTLATTRAGDATKSAAGTHLEGFCVAQATQGTSTSAHGIWMRASATLDRLSYYQIAGHAIYNRAYSAGSGADRGNTNDWKVINNFVYSCGLDGMHTTGSDANAGYCIGFETKFCGGCGIYDVGTLGNTYIAPQISGYGTYGGTVAGVYHLGHNYQLIVSVEYGETLGNTTTPGTAPHVWYDLGTAGAASAAFPQWVSGTSYTFHAPIHITSNSNFSTVINPYIEAGATLGHADGPAIVYGGLSTWTHRTAQIRATQALVPTLGVATGIGAYKTSIAGTSERTNFGSYQYTQLGTGNITDGAYPPNILSHGREKDAVAMHWGYDSNDPNHHLWYAGQKRIWSITAPLTAQTFGRSTAQPYYIAFTDFGMIDPADGNNARIYGIRSAVPSSGYHAQGEIYWNSAASLTGVLAWVATVSGTPGTFAANYINARADPSTGIGYLTGAGGTVSQSTSKSTGVTLNKVCGEITMDNAALAAGVIVSFTLTDSAIGAGDVLVLNHVSGGTLGAYALNAACAAGSATIYVRNATAGSLSQAIVIRFAVVKGAIS